MGRPWSDDLKLLKLLAEHGASVSGWHYKLRLSAEPEVERLIRELEPLKERNELEYSVMLARELIARGLVEPDGRYEKGKRLEAELRETKPILEAALELPTLISLIELLLDSSDRSEGRRKHLLGKLYRFHEAMGLPEVLETFMNREALNLGVLKEEAMKQLRAQGLMETDGKPLRELRILVEPERVISLGVLTPQGLRLYWFLLREGKAAYLSRGRAVYEIAIYRDQEPVVNLLSFLAQGENLLEGTLSLELWLTVESLLSWQELSDALRAANLEPLPLGPEVLREVLMQEELWRHEALLSYHGSDIESLAFKLEARMDELFEELGRRGLLRGAGLSTFAEKLFQVFRSPWGVSLSVTLYNFWDLRPLKVIELHTNFRGHLIGCHELDRQVLRFCTLSELLDLLLAHQLSEERT